MHINKPVSSFLPLFVESKSAKQDYNWTELICWLHAVQTFQSGEENYILSTTLKTQLFHLQQIIAWFFSVVS